MNYFNIDKYYSRRFNCNAVYKDTYSDVRRIIVIGDLHGDFNILIKSLELGGLIDRNLNWIGQNTHVVQLGDILDGGGRGIEYNAEKYDEFKIYDFLNNLNRQANKQGGYVHYLIGNHELMNIIGEFEYVHPNQMVQDRYNLFQPGSYMTKMLACHSYAVLRINDWIFCHAGLLPQHLEGNTITTLNMLVKDLLMGKKNMRNISNREKNLIYSESSVFWTREYENNNNKCNILNETLQKIGSKNGGMVVGHTPHKNIKSNCNNRLWFADVGLSRAFGQINLQVLEIKDNIPRVLGKNI